jgi:hypothetical protein
VSVTGCGRLAPEGVTMKIYLLLTLMSTLLVAIRLTSVPNQTSKTLPQ